MASSSSSSSSNSGTPMAMAVPSVRKLAFEMAAPNNNTAGTSSSNIVDQDSDIDEGFDEFPEEFPFWYGGASGEQRINDDLVSGADLDAGADTDDRQPALLSTSQKAFFPLDQFMAKRMSIDLRQSSTTTITSTTTAAGTTATATMQPRPTFHDHDSVLHFFVATSQSERLLDDYISGIIKAFLDEPAPIYASDSTDRRALAASRFGSLDIPKGGTPSSGDLEAYLNHLKVNIIERATRTGSSKMIGHMTTALPFFHRPLARLLAALNQNVVKIETASTFTNLERQTLAMLHKEFYGQTDAFYDQYAYSPDAALGVMASGGTIANITALWMARNRALAANGAIDCRGVDKEGIATSMAKYGYKRAVIIGSTLLHYSFKKAADLIGLGDDGLCLIPTDASFRMRIDLLQATVEKLIAENVLIIAIVAVAGTTEAGSIDPLMDIGKLAAKHGIHLHVDAAWGGPMIFSPEHNSKLDGISLADTITIDGHKQLYTPMGLGVLLTRSPSLATYIRKTANYVIRNDSPDLGKYTLEGSRPANVLFLHASLSLLGREGLGIVVTRSATIVRQMSVRLSSHPSQAFEVLHEPMSNLLLYRFIPTHLRKSIADGTYSPNATDEAHINELTRRLQTKQATVAPAAPVNLNMPMTPRESSAGFNLDAETSDPRANRPLSSASPTATATGSAARYESIQSHSTSGSLTSPPRGFVSRTRVAYKGFTTDAFRVVIANPLTTWQDVESVISEQLQLAPEIEAELEREHRIERLRRAYPGVLRGSGNTTSDWWAGWPFDL